MPLHSERFNKLSRALILLFKFRCYIFQFSFHDLSIKFTKYVASHSTLAFCVSVLIAVGFLRSIPMHRSNNIIFIFVNDYLRFMIRNLLYFLIRNELLVWFWFWEFGSGIQFMSIIW